MARALLIFNPAAARMDADVVRVVSRVFLREGWDLDVAGTTRSGHAGTLAQQAADDGVDLIAIYGGDGTTMQAVRGIVGRDVPVALIPGGTGNVLAGNLRLPREPEAAAMLAVRGRTKAIDLGRVERADGCHYFAVACGAGLDARLMAATTEEAKRRWGVGAYVARTLGAMGTLNAVPCRITVDGTSADIQAVMVLVANCREYVPPFLALRDAIALDDGQLDVIGISANTAMQGVAVAWRFLVGQAEGAHGVWFARGSRIEVSAEPAQPVQMDGEAHGTTPFTAEVVPGALRVIVEHGSE